PPDIKDPEQVGDFRILERIGIGGMGVGYVAEQTRPFHRQVALKLIKRGMDSKQVLARFELERQALALMNHESIAKVFAAGSTEGGQPYFVMEFVEGVPLNRYCDQHGLTLEERIALFQQVCAGVQHAHQKGVVHRDLKPGNILASRRGEQHVAKIIDFGLARATDQQLVSQTVYTEQGRLVGTPEYMSPEQAGGSSLQLDTRTDIYSLGVVLYELLTGELPFPTEMLRSAGELGIQRILCEEEPKRPSSRVSTHGGMASEAAVRRRISQPALRRALRGDLDWIVMKAMAKERERRYASANGLAMDLERFLTHEPVAAGPPGTIYRLSKFVRKYRVHVTAAALLFLVMAAGIFGTTRFMLEARAEKARFDRLAVVVHLEEAQQEQQALHPAWPDKITALERWLQDRGRPLRAELPRVRQTLQELEQIALPQTDLEKQRDREGTVRHRQSFRFADQADGFLYETLRRVEQDLVAFLGKKGGLADVESRSTWANRVGELTVTRHQKRWDEARSALRKADDVTASKLYADQPIHLNPQMGLVPIGMNPKTGLWEFYHLRSAWDPTKGMAPEDLEIPKHGVDGSLQMAGRGIVFVLIPGGTFRMGAQKVDKSAPNHDRWAWPREAPVHEVALRPFFLSRYEMTQGQWARLTGGEYPSHHKLGQRYFSDPVPIGDAHPVELVRWEDCQELMRHHGLLLPTEAQWEYGCRAKTSTPWFTGREAGSMAGHANVSDPCYVVARHGSPYFPGAGWVAEFRDGYAGLAPVGVFKPNDFGLHDAYGNVWEWCRDRYGSYSLPVQPGDGLRQVDAALTVHVYRGSCYQGGMVGTRSTTRVFGPPSFSADNLGLRPAREITPP
ncbi:MAG: protein kinase domain-containing protein, partial [Planctomycetota bacterium]